MLSNLDKISKLVSTTVEPDVSAAMTQAIVDPVELKRSHDEEDYRILPHTLVFTRSLANQLAEESERPPLKRSKTESVKYPHVLGGGMTKNIPLFVLGVAYDGIPNASAAKHWPNERGRLVVQITGTCTLAIIQKDLDDLEVLDRLQIDRKKQFSDSIAEIENYSIPHICKFKTENRGNMEELLKTIETLLSEEESTEETKTTFIDQKFTAGYADIDCFVEKNDDIKDVSLEDQDGQKKMKIDKGKLKYFQKLVEQECKPFGVLLEKGSESARILLTP